MIIIIPQHGLLNRIRSILSAKLVADLINEDLYVLWIPQIGICNCYYEDILGNNNILWKGICSNDIDNFIKKHNITILNAKKDDITVFIDNIPMYFYEKDNVCTLRGHIPQNFMNQFIASNCLIKIIITGECFRPLNISKGTYNNEKMKLYSQLVFSSAITENIPTIPKNTLGLQLRFRDRGHYAPSPNEIIDAINKMINKNPVKNIKIISDDLDRALSTMNILQKNYDNIDVSISDIKITCRNSCVGLQYAMVDWLTLCRCDYLIFSWGSSFGYEAFISNLNRDVDEIPKRSLLC